MAQDHLFNSIQVKRPTRNTFSLGHTVNMSFNMGTLVPTCCVDLLPGDIVNIKPEAFIRFAPLIAPINSVVNVTMWFFVVPDRILFKDQREWEDFIADIQNSDTEYPHITAVGNVNQGKLLDYLYGIDTVYPNAPLTAAPVAAYCLIYDEWYRNQQLTTTDTFEPLVINVNQNANYASVLQSEPFRRTWEKDYFTSALPNAQLGAEVLLPLVDGGPVDVEMSGLNTNVLLRDVTAGNVLTTTGNVQNTNQGVLQSDNTSVMFDPNGTLSVNIQAAASTINELRAAYRLQEFLEIQNMGGTRYTEVIRSMFGVVSPDSRLSRPELLGKWTGRMSVSEVLQTSAPLDDGSTGSGTPLGTMGGHGVSVIGGESVTYRAYEHCWLMGIINVQPKPVYQQGLARKYSRLYPLDYYWPKLAHIGEQEILNKEIYLPHSSPNGTFGYTPRYAEYRYEQGRVAGEMRNELAHWHLGRIFASEPALNEDFVYCSPSARIFNVLYTGGSEPEYSGDQLFGLVYNGITASRLMPKYGRPTL
jgi:hypothetical protein